MNRSEMSEEKLREELEKKDRRIAELEAMEIQHERAKKILSVEREILEMVAVGCSTRTILGSLSTMLEQLLPGASTSILLLDEVGRHQPPGYAPVLPEGLIRKMRSSAVGPCIGSCGCAVYRDETVIVENLESDPSWSAHHEAALARGLHTCWSVPFRGSTGRILGVLAVYNDLPQPPSEQDLQIIRTAANLAGIAVERKRSEDALRESEEKYRRLFEESRDALFVTSLEGEIIDLNPSASSLFGFTREETVGRMNVSAIYVHQDDREKFKRQMQEKQSVTNFDVKLRRKDGTQMDCLLTATVRQSKDGTVLGFQGSVRDITRYKRAQEALQESEKRYRSLYENTPVMLHSIDPQGRIISVSNYWLENLGYDADEVIGRKSVDFLTEASRRTAEEVVLPEYFSTGVIKNVPYQFVKKNNEVIDVLLSAIAERDEAGNMVRSLAVLIDVTEHKRAEEKIVEQNKFLNTVIESLPHPFYVLDAADYTIKMANSAAAPTGLVAGTTCYEMTHRRPIPCDDPDHICPLEMIRSTKKPVTVEHIHYDMEGSPRNFEVHGYPIFDNKGNVAQIIEYSFDITERKLLEEALRNNAEKVKLFAYSVSHDLKSPAVGICGLARLLQKQYMGVLDEKGRKYCEQIVKASEQIVALIDEINVFIRTKETPLVFENIKPQEILQMVRDEFSALLSVRRIDWSEPESIPEIRADRVSILRVFRNYVENALKYGGEGLSVIRIGYEESDQAHTFSVMDDGVGINEEDSEKIFKPFQRNDTSRGIEGTGLGLAIVKEIAEKHCGRAWAEPGPRKGATFHISISKVL